MDYFEVIEKRRSIRRFGERHVPDEVIDKALSAAILAPNSSNAQTWDFYWVASSDAKAQLVEACLNQSAARTASHLIVFVASPSSWKRSWKELVAYVEKINAPEPVKKYYKYLFPLLYRSGFLNFLGFSKWVVAEMRGFFKPTPRGPFTLKEIQTVSIKSAALAAENFVLAVTAQGFASCMMEGYDERRVKRLLNLKFSDRVVMVVGVGEESQSGTWGPRFRLPKTRVIHKI